KENARVARVHRDVRAAGVLVDEQRTRPRPAAIARAEHAALLLRTIRVPQRARDDDVGVARIDDDAADAPGLLEARARPCLADGAEVSELELLVDVRTEPRIRALRRDEVGRRQTGGQGAGCAERSTNHLEPPGKRLTVSRRLIRSGKVGVSLFPHEDEARTGR